MGDNAGYGYIVEQGERVLLDLLLQMIVGHYK